MNRDEFYKKIERHLNLLAREIESGGSINLHDYSLHSENFYRDLLNLVYGWELINLNVLKQNEPAIDLKDDAHHIVMQVSSTATTQKINDSLAKLAKNAPKYQGYQFKFLSISKDAKNLRNKTYAPPVGISFEPIADIYDVKSILRKIFNLSIDELKSVYELVHKELGGLEYALVKESNLAKIIKLIAQQKIPSTCDEMDIQVFDIQNKIVFNDLIISQDLIHDLKIMHSKVTNIYSVFDEEGCNKSYSVLMYLNRIYRKGQSKLYKGDELFDYITQELEQELCTHFSLQEISKEELSLSIEVLLVDAFMRCKIFKKPNTQNNVTTR